jgi:ubiquinone/menaquinone biosynthesis C-methylase UbiE
MRRFLPALILLLAAASAAGQTGRVVETLKLRPGDRVADVGAGAGRYTVPLAKAVAPGGAVWAVDIDERALERNQEAVRNAGLANVKWVLAAEDDPRIPEPVDLVFFSDSLHHIHGQEAYLKNLRKYLKPGGRVAVIDFARNWPGAHHIRRYTVDELDGWMKGAGFTRVETYDFPADRFFAIYR